MIGFVPGDSPLHRAHPYTPLALAAGLFMIAFAAANPGAVGVVVALSLALALAAGAARELMRPLLVFALPTWVLLLVVHGLLGPEPYRPVGPLEVSAAGFERALVLGGRVTAIVTAFVAALAAVSPARLVEAMSARGAGFKGTFLLVSTLTLVPRLRGRATRVLEAQQCRGLRIGGSPLARARTLAPLVLPLVLGALSEVDEQVLALEARGATAAARRTALDPPADPWSERLLRMAVMMTVMMAYMMKFMGRGL
jgi:energy-coupling factor transport system permease protein